MKSLQIKPSISTKIASQIAQNTNTRPHGLQVTLIVMEPCQAKHGDGVFQDIDKADMKNDKQCHVVLFDNTEKCLIVSM